MDPKASKNPITTHEILHSIQNYYKAATNLSSKHISIALNLVDAKEFPPTALFLREGENFKVFRKEGLFFSPAEVSALEENGVLELYIERKDVPVFSAYLDKKLIDLPSSSMADQKRMELFRSSALQVIDGIFQNPSPENIERGTKTVAGFVYTLMKDPRAYEILLGLSSHDPYTLQHSMGTSTNAIILAKKLGIEEESNLIEVGVAGLLHDVGKTKVPKAIINKPGPLDEHEWAIMKQHATFGYEILKDNPNVGMQAKLGVLQHHENSTGQGYPLGLSGDQISLFAKIVCLADIFNAITTDRPYSKAKTPFEAFTLIKDKMMDKVDATCFEALVKIYGGKI